MKLLASLLLFIFSFLIFGEIDVAESSSQNHPFSGRNKLFVFGDSYVDIGNTNTSDKGAWEYPYGITYPGKPSGRFSDGHISTDFLAQLLRIKLPVNYAKKDDVDMARLQYGMSFAYGGTGVFKTYANYSDMTAQINLFEQLLGNVYSPSDLSSSVALFSVAGNDYITFLAGNHTIFEKLLGIRPLIEKVVNQTEVNLRRIRSLGVKKIAIPSLSPLQYIPLFANSSNPIHYFQGPIKDLVKYHNDLLQKSVAKLNNESNDIDSPFTIIDYYNTFLAIFNNTGEIPGILPFPTPYIECLRDGKLCDDPRSAFFWDGIHLTQEGWKSVYKVLRKDIIAALMPKA
ncbi:GDSL esterase/lipase [Raphanus sativus]|nr:GDSL esterase/lipase [Raphanus sativus]